MDELAKFSVARDAAFAIAQDFGRRQVDQEAVRVKTVLQVARVVVQGDRAGMRGTERIEEVRQRYLLPELARISIHYLRKRAFL